MWAKKDKKRIKLGNLAMTRLKRQCHKRVIINVMKKIFKKIVLE